MRKSQTDKGEKQGRFLEKSRIKHRKTYNNYKKAVSFFDFGNFVSIFAN